MGLNVASYANNEVNNQSILLMIQKANHLGLTTSHSKSPPDVIKWQKFYDYLYDPSTGPFRAYNKHATNRKQRKFAKDAIIKICGVVVATITNEADATNLQQHCKTFLDEYNSNLTQSDALQVGVKKEGKRKRGEGMDEVENQEVELIDNNGSEGLRQIRRQNEAGELFLNHVNHGTNFQCQPETNTFPPLNSNLNFPPSLSQLNQKQNQMTPIFYTEDIIIFQLGSKICSIMVSECELNLHEATMDTIKRSNNKHVVEMRKALGWTGGNFNYLIRTSSECSAGRIPFTDGQLMNMKLHKLINIKYASRPLFIELIQVDSSTNDNDYDNEECLL